MITDWIGRHEVLLRINHIYNKIRERKGRKRTGEGIDNSFTIRKKNLFKCNWSIRAHALTRPVQLLRHDAYTVQWHCPNCPINALIVSITKCSNVIGSPRAYLIRNWRVITWASNYSCPIWTSCNWIAIIGQLRCARINQVHWNGFFL